MSRPCWCGEKKPYYSDELDENCGGMGVVICYCGGDFCVCHWHGEVQCEGCPDCENADGDEFGDED